MLRLLLSTLLGYNKLFRMHGTFRTLVKYDWFPVLFPDKKSRKHNGKCIRGPLHASHAPSHVSLRTHNM